MKTPTHGSSVFIKHNSNKVKGYSIEKVSVELWPELDLSEPIIILEDTESPTIIGCTLYVYIFEKKAPNLASTATDRS